MRGLWSERQALKSLETRNIQSVAGGLTARSYPKPWGNGELQKEVEESRDLNRSVHKITIQGQNQW